jgi:hypothetical protein
VHVHLNPHLPVLVSLHDHFELSLVLQSHSEEFAVSIVCGVEGGWREFDGMCVRDGGASFGLDGVRFPR